MNETKQDQPGPRVSDEDRQAAIKIASLAMLRTRSQRFWPDAAVNALISDGGWGPRPRVDGAKLDDISDGYANVGVGDILVIKVSDLPAILRECGIEVTDQ